MNIQTKRVWGGKQATGNGGGGGSNAFNGERDITRNTPGIIGFDPNTTTINAFLEEVFYPPIPPECAISVDNPIREIGQSDAYTLTWEVTEETNTITGITVDGNAITPTGASQSGTQTGNFANTYGSYTKSMTATDGITTPIPASCSVQYLPRYFWGTTTKDGLTDAPILDADILALANSNLTDTRALTLTNFGGGATYLIFALPSSFGIPSFVINGLANTAFTKVRAASNFVNAEGATIVMDVWVSNYLYNSPLDSVIVN
jgi:hypothetical protein